MILRIKILIPVILALLLVGCEPRDEGSFDLGANYFLIRLHNNVTIMDPSTIGDPEIPGEIVSVGFNSHYIVAYSVSNAVTNFWIISKKERTVTGPLGKEEFDEFSSTNQSLRNLKQKNVWDY